MGGTTSSSSVAEQADPSKYYVSGSTNKNTSQQQLHKRFVVTSKHNGRRYRLDTDELLQSAGGSTLFSLYNGSCLDDDDGVNSSANNASSPSVSSRNHHPDRKGISTPSRSPLTSPSSSPPSSLSTSPEPASSQLRSSLANSLPRVSFFVFCKADASQLAHSLPNLNAHDDREAIKDSEIGNEQQELSADALLDAARNYVLRIKKNRHPYIGRYIESIENRSVVAIITEHLIPLSAVFPSLTLAEVRLGLYQLFSGIHFLHVEGGISHNNITLSSIFVRPSTNEWCLGGFEFAGNNQTNESSLLSASFRSHAEISSLCKRDTWAIGCLLQEVLSHLEPQIQGTNELLYPLKELVQRLLKTSTSQPPAVLSSEPQQNADGLTCEGAMISPFFATDEILEISNFLSNITLKAPNQKKQFFQNLPNRLKGWISKHEVSGFTNEEATIGKIVIPRLMSPQVLMDPFLHLSLPTILSPNIDSSDPEKKGLLPLSVYDAYVLPHICSAFTLRDYNIRQTLLRHTKYFFPFIRPPSKQADIFKEMLLGLKDKSNSLVLSTLAALQAVVLLWTDASDYVPTNIETLISLQLNQIRDLLKDEDECIRSAALEHMAELIGSYDELQKNTFDICEMMKDSSLSVRISALRAIRKIKNKITPKKLCVDLVIPSLLSSLQDANTEIRHLSEVVICELVTLVASTQPLLPKAPSNKDSLLSPITVQLKKRTRFFTGAVFSPSQNVSLLNGDELVLLDSLGKDSDDDDLGDNEPIAEGYLREDISMDAQLRQNNNNNNIINNNYNNNHTTNEVADSLHDDDDS